GVEVLHLARDAAVVGLRVELRDRHDAALPVDERLPGFLDSGPDRTHPPQSGDDDTTVHGRSSVPRCRGAAVRQRLFSLLFFGKRLPTPPSAAAAGVSRGPACRWAEAHVPPSTRPSTPDYFLWALM